MRKACLSTACGRVGQFIEPGFVLFCFFVEVLQFSLINDIPKRGILTFSRNKISNVLQRFRTCLDMRYIPRPLSVRTLEYFIYLRFIS